MPISTKLDAVLVGGAGRGTVYLLFATHPQVKVEERGPAFGTPLRSGHEALGHELVNVVVVSVLDARAEAAGPRGPQAVSDPAFAEGGHARGRPVRGIACVEGVREIEVLYLDRVASGGYPREDVCVPAYGGEGGIVLDPAQHVRYTACVHKITPYGPGLGVLPTPPGPFSCLPLKSTVLG